MALFSKMGRGSATSVETLYTCRMSLHYDYSDTFYLIYMNHHKELNVVPKFVCAYASVLFLMGCWLSTTAGYMNII